MVLLRGSPRGLGVLFRVVLRATGLHFLLRHFPLLIFLTLAIIPLSWAWANFVTPSVWFTKKVLVETECGPVQGFTQEKVSYFLGVPYAMPPLRELRWRSPRPAKRWRKPYDASYFRAECQQGKLHNIDRPKVLSEDCLFLNIWAPSTATWKKPVPVMVWLYGGAFQQGGTSKVEYYGENMAAKGVVLVSCNYRLGALGFLVSVEDGLYGNYGLQDQRFCLEWVQRNIRGFGGDPNSVTLFGESAGAMAVGQHLLMSGAGRLFHRVIMQSNPFSYHYRSLTIANFLGQAVKRGIDCHDLRCMQEEPVDELLDVQDTLHGMPRSVGDFFTWGPVVREGPWRNAAEWTARMEVPITVQQPLRVLEAPNFVNTVPVILGTCKDEGHMFVYNVFPFPLPKYLYWAFVGLLFRDSAPKVIRYYWDMAEKQCRANATAKADYRPVLSSILNDYMFRCPSWRAAHLLQEKSRPGVPVYVYQFAHPTRVPGYPECQGLSCHTAELPYVFNNLEIISKAYALKNEAQNISAIRKAFNDLFFDVLFKVNRDERLASLMSDYWTSFGKTADPNFKGAKVRWPQWKGRRRYHLQQNPVDDAYSETGRRGRKGGKAVATREGGGGKGGGKVQQQQQQQQQQEPHYLELKWPPEVHLATRDCTCDFWDKIGYKY